MPREYRTTRGWRPGKVGRPIKWTLNTTQGRWRLNLTQICRERGYVLTEGPHAGRVNVYRLAAETGFSAGFLYKIRNDRKAKLGLPSIARLCDVLRCQPSDILERVWDGTVDDDEYELPNS